MKNLFLGKAPRERKYLPKVIEHLYSFFSAIIFSISLIFFIFLLINTEEKNLQDKLFLLLNKMEFRLIISFFVFCFLVNIVYVIRLVRILPKTESGKILVYLEIIFLILFFLSFINLFVSLSCLKFNEIVFE
ncbi:hypothetical protein [Mesomycoplasma lagogenitalium]|uniref:Uncharacterized protein n=1 Tax=Mesomycoplasma lagogenitalium TaxID=171286 RepID=A0ABY8LU24_9BACT|nr:hypothetical protein [Mesomycoplasma lagogenitalium]WGI36743.1 hypothetical protein QEG99_00435 [Mesomycoplasma lagogenitalium]